METLSVECLRCGAARSSGRVQGGSVQVGVCPRCGYVGWAPSVELTEGARRGLRERPVEQRRLRAA